MRTEEEPAATDREGRDATRRWPRRTRTSSRGSRKKRPWWHETLMLAGVALVLALLVKTFLIQAFSIPSGSMENTLQKDDRVLVDKLTPWFGAKPHRGEVVVFSAPDGWSEELPEQSSTVPQGVQKALSFIGLMPSAEEKHLIKRVIGVGGDTITCTAGEPVKVNGTPLNEPYLHPDATPCDDAPVGTVKVPEGQLWVMGDHRNDSADSRAHRNAPGQGFVPVKNVIGRAVAIAWPLSRWDTLPVPDTSRR
ncbi:signal peptidase I [Streptomyces roseoverticillatus]|uniref:signal peptidase I n=1 Tax=Streptomyces roseoverticillatus TaxID=66429 RepID=UPI001F273268|nr:signal peptidase I [Streptomyces roseoverticillatus]